MASETFKTIVRNPDGTKREVTVTTGDRELKYEYPANCKTPEQRQAFRRKVRNQIRREDKKTAKK